MTRTQIAISSSCRLFNAAPIAHHGCMDTRSKANFGNGAFYNLGSRSAKAYGGSGGGGLVSFQSSVYEGLYIFETFAMLDHWERCRRNAWGSIGGPRRMPVVETLLQINFLPTVLSFPLTFGDIHVKRWMCFDF